VKRVCIIGAAGDSLTQRLPAVLARQGWSAPAIEPERLSDLRVSIDHEHLLVEGETVGAIVFRAATNTPFSASFPDSDHAFCDAETRAIWLAAVNLPDITSFNRLDAIAWFETEHWTVWRRVLARRGVPLARCELGYAREEGSRMWLPFSAPVPQADPGESIARAGGSARFAEQRLTRSLIACGRVVSGPGGATIEAAVRELARAGVKLAEIVTDEAGDIAWVDTLPRALSDSESERVVELIAAEIAGGFAERAP